MTLKHLGILLFCPALATACQTQKTVTPEKPNVLFILADDLGYADLSCMGSTYYETPNTDQIARQGMVFTNGYAACSVCSPSRASILTGKFPPRHGITDWIGEASGEEWRKMGRSSVLLPASYEHALPAQEITLAEAFKEAGYTTFFAGKWHLGGEGSSPEDHGFDINKGGYEAGGPRGGYFSPFSNPKLPDGPAGENLEMRLAKETVSFMEAQAGKPFLAYLSFYAVHGPIETTREKWAKYREKAEKAGIADQGFDMEKRLPYRLYQDNPIYGGLVESMDDAVGVVLDALKRLGLDKNTIVVFTSDNGGVTSGDSYSTSNKPLRGGKGYQWEGGIREPYLIDVPWLKLDGKRCDAPVSGTDFYPTLLDLAGLPLKPDQHRDGLSLVPLFKGEQLQKRALIWHYPHYGNQGGDPCSIIRKGDWKLIYYHEDDHEELYNLREDEQEAHNLLAEQSELASTLHRELFEYLKETNAIFPEKDPIYNAKSEQQYQQNIREQKWPSLEKQRKEQLSPNFNPGHNWWDSEPVTE